MEKRWKGQMSWGGELQREQTRAKQLMRVKVLYVSLAQCKRQREWVKREMLQKLNVTEVESSTSAHVGQNYFSSQNWSHLNVQFCPIWLFAFCIRKIARFHSIDSDQNQCSFFAKLWCKGKMSACFTNDLWLAVESVVYVTGRGSACTSSPRSTRN